MLHKKSLGTQITLLIVTAILLGVALGGGFVLFILSGAYLVLPFFAGGLFALVYLSVRFVRRVVVHPIAQITDSIISPQDDADAPQAQAAWHTAISAHISSLQKQVTTLQKGMNQAASAIAEGNMHYRLPADDAADAGVLLAINAMLTGFGGFLDAIRLPILTVDKNLYVTYANRRALELSPHMQPGKPYPVHVFLGISTSSMLNLQPGEHLLRQKTIEGEADIYHGAASSGSSARVLVVADTSDISKKITRLEKINRFTARQFYGMTSRLSLAFADGKLDVAFDKNPYDDADLIASAKEFNAIMGMLSENIDYLGGYILEIREFLAQVAKRNFGATISRKYKGDFAPIRDHLLEVFRMINHFFGGLSGFLMGHRYDGSRICESFEAILASRQQAARALDEARTCTKQLISQNRRILARLGDPKDPLAQITDKDFGDSVMIQEDVMNTLMGHLSHTVSIFAEKKHTTSESLKLARHMLETTGKMQEKLSEYELGAI